MSARGSVSKRLRYEVLRRDNFTCRYCGRSAPDVPLTVDHVKPVSLGGSDDAANLVTACGECNTGKSSSAPDAATVEDVSADAQRWALAVAAAAASMEEEIEIRRSIIEAFDDQWCQWRYMEFGEPESLPRDKKWPASIIRFFSLGLSLTIMSDLIETAMHSGTDHDHIWRYFCGCCWRTIERLHAEAMQSVTDESGVPQLADGGPTP